MNINDIITGIVLLAMLFTAEHMLDTVFLPYYVLVVFGFMLLIKGFTDFTPEKIKKMRHEIQELKLVSRHTYRKIQSNNQSDIQQTDFHPGIQPELPTNISTNTPNPNMKGVFRDGYEWIVWPENSGKHWYRSEGSIDGWSEYQS
jgi:hypothetical protein